jgi:hypothetical protein
LWYFFVFIAFIIWLFFIKDKKYFFLYLSLYLFLFIGFRNTFTYFSITKEWLQNHTFSVYENKTFFDLWDYIVFTDKVGKALNLDDKNIDTCNIYAASIRDWPFKSHFESVYLKPCELVDDLSKADYLIYYKKIPENTQKFKEILNFNGSYLLKK